MRLRLLIAVAAALALPGVAQADVQTLVLHSAPVTIGPYGVVQSQQLVPSPAQDGDVVGISADVVDQQGVPEPISHVMLHHIVFAKLGVPDTTCSQFVGYDGRASLFPTQRFYAEGEERTAIVLPPGYGYPNRATDHWGMLFMLMNHRPVAETVTVQYTIRYATGESLIPVTPVWLDVRNCRADPVFDVPGTGPLFSTFSTHSDVTLPIGGTIVAGGAHLHGGGLSLALTDESCSGRPLFRSEPTWGLPLIRPIMHEPGPKHMTTFSQADGIPVAAGDTLRLTATYDDSLPHTRVMGIMILYLAPGSPQPCASVPALAPDPLSSPGAPPRIRLPLLRAPTGPVRNALSTWVGDFAFGAQRIALRRGQTFDWHFAGVEAHNVTLASGPVGFSSTSFTTGNFRYRFTRPGTYMLFCSLHPTLMTQEIVVR